ncbi:MAG TPA: glycosyltransferase family 2 protein [Tepidisphaeraceae bacterium]|jgi:cellulose synthase/poly-beta-1,6-N-acetylglucosamine synthase-like glycosyltransferase
MASTPQAKPSDSPIQAIMNQPLFTILIPTYNRGHLIEATVQSVVNQRFDSCEIVVVDDGSTDNTQSVLEKFGEHVRVFTQSNAGPGAARNLGITQALGEYVIFLDSDDLQFPWTLQNFAALIDKHGRPAAIGTHEVNFSHESELASIPGVPLVATVFPDLLSFYGSRPPVTFPTGAVAVRTDVLRAVGGFPAEKNVLCEDIDLWLRIGIQPGFIHVATPPSYGLRQHPGNTSKLTVRSAVGLQDVIRDERAGCYPGGRGRKRERLALITFVGRAIIVQCSMSRQTRWAWLLYLKLLPWHLRLGRFKFVSLAPPVIAKNMFKTSVP